MGSHRLQGKVLRPLLNRPMLAWMIERIRPSRWANRILLATTTRPEDDALDLFARQVGIGCFRGSDEDLLGRLSAAARQARAETLVVLLGDNPLVDYRLLDDVVRLHQDGSYDFTTNLTPEYPFAPSDRPRFPVGVRVQVLSRETLTRCERLASDPADREHATRFIAEHPGQFRIGYLEASGAWSSAAHPELHLAVNTREEFERMQRIFESCRAQDPQFSVNRAVQAALQEQAWTTHP